MHYASNHGVRIRYEVVGDGPPLVLHCGGLGGALEDWFDAGFVTELRGEYQIILFDPRGQGQSDKPHDPAAYTYDRAGRVGDVLAVLDEVGIERAHFWGYSLGARIGFAIGVHAPERVYSLILGGADPNAYEGPMGDEDPVIQGFRRGMASTIAEWETRSADFWISEDERERWLAADPNALIASWTAGTAHPGFADALPSMRMPALLYCGTADNPDPVRQAAHEMPNATFIELEGLDHAQGYARYDLVLPHVKPFLERLTQASAP